MKHILILIFVGHTLTLHAQSKYLGKWEGNTGTWIEIKNKTSEFEVSANQLGLVCKNVEKGNYLYLLTSSSDQGTAFNGQEYLIPKKGKFFAKCRIINDTLHVRYLNKVFCDVSYWGTDSLFYRTE